MPSRFFLALQTNSPPQTPVSPPPLLTHLKMWEDSRKCLQHQPPRKTQAIFKNHCTDHLKQDCYSSPVASFIGGQAALDPIKPHGESEGHGNESAITLSLPSWKKSCHPDGKTCGKEVALRPHPAGRTAKRANSPAESSSSAAPTQAGTGHVSEPVLETPLLPPLWNSRPSWHWVKSQETRQVNPRSHGK